MIADKRFAFENLSNHDLFVNVPEEKFRPYIRCEYCIHADFTNPKAPKGYIDCKKYKMFSLYEMTCKSGEKKKTLKDEKDL